LRHRTLIGNRARSLRKTMSEPEVILWGRLRGRGPDRPTFRRQHPIGSMILDFYCPSARLAVEIDGSTHWDDAARARDQARDRWLERQGVSVMRIPASQVYRDLSATVDGVLRRAEELRDAQGVGLSPSTPRSEFILGPASGRTRGARGPPPAASRGR
jgi:very-short-patch-repair endonuclease